MCGFCVVFQSVSSPDAWLYWATARPRFHRVRDQPLVDDALLEDDARGLGLLEGGVDVTAAHDPVERLVALDVGVELWRVGFGRRFRIDHRRQRLVVDLDQVERVVGLIAIVGDHHRDDVAGVADDLLGDARIGGDLQVGIGEEPGAWHRLQRAVDVGAGVDGQHPRRGDRLGGVDLRDLGVGVRAAQHRGVHHAGQRDVVGIRGASGDQPRVFPAANAGAEDSRAHRYFPAMVWAASLTARTMF